MIIERLKKFIAYKQYSSSEFADKINLPRPSLSQIMNGRNKKISNEVFEKIHFAFPELNMLWLMFGEGEMLNNANANTVYERNSPNIDKDFTSQPNLFSNSKTTNIQNENNALEYQKYSGSSEDENRTPTPSQQEKKEAPSQTRVKIYKVKRYDSIENNQNHLSFYKAKQIKKIMILYSDNTFQYFHPDNNEFFKN